MRLIHANTLRIEDFPSEDASPPYAILSHTWGTPEQECTLQSMSDPDVSPRIGYTKIKLCCDQALKDGLSWAWVDTCCIDKTSTAELSEAINSMFRWYQNASICYAFIEDANTVDDLEKSRWFTRGWTLQELVAPHDIVFFSKSWCQLGRKLQLKDSIWKITGIEPAVLESGILSNVTVAKKMVGEFCIPVFWTAYCSNVEEHAPEANSICLPSADHEPTQSWAAKRQTTRVEDLAYCLLGIFDVNMPMLYGEGKKAFIRLQEEIMKSSYDHTLFAWSRSPPTTMADGFIEDEATSSTSEPKKLCGLLAASPTMFLHSKDIVPVTDNFQSGNDVTSGSGRIVIRLPAFRKGTQFFAALPCIAGSSYLALPLDAWHPDFVARRALMVLVQPNDLYTPSGELAIQRFQVKPPVQEPIHAPPPTPDVSYIVMLRRDSHPVYDTTPIICSPHANYDEDSGHLTLTSGYTGLHAAYLLEPKYDQLPGDEMYFMTVAVLIGGDVTGDGKLWIAMVPVLPDTDTDEAFHAMFRRDPELTTHCITRSMLINQIVSRSGASAFSTIGRQQVKDWVLHEYHWFELHLRYAYLRGRIYRRVPHKKTISVTANIDLVHAHPTEKAFKLTTTFGDAG